MLPAEVPVVGGAPALARLPADRGAPATTTSVARRAALVLPAGGPPNFAPSASRSGLPPHAPTTAPTAAPSPAARSLPLPSNPAPARASPPGAELPTVGGVHHFPAASSRRRPEPSRGPPRRGPPTAPGPPTSRTRTTESVRCSLAPGAQPGSPVRRPLNCVRVNTILSSSLDRSLRAHPLVATDPRCFGGPVTPRVPCVPCRPPPALPP